MISAADYLSGKTTSQTKKYGGPVTVRAEDYLKALELPEIKEISAPKAAENATWTAKTSGNDTHRADLAAGAEDLTARGEQLSVWEQYLKAAEENVNAARKRWSSSGRDEDLDIYRRTVDEYNSGLNEARRAAEMYKSLLDEYDREAATARREYMTAAAEYEGKSSQWARAYSGWLEAEKSGQREMADHLLSELTTGQTAQYAAFATPEQRAKLEEVMKERRKNSARRSVGDFWTMKAAELGENAAALLPFEGLRDRATEKRDAARAAYEKSSSEHARIRDEALEAGAGSRGKAVLEGGITQAAGGIADFIGMADKLLKIDPENQSWALLGKLARNVKAEQAAAQERLAKTTQNMGQRGKIAANLGVSTIAAIPNALFATLSGGGSAAALGMSYTAEGAFQLAPALSTAEQLAGMERAMYTTKNVLESVAKNPSYWSSFISAAGSSYKEAMEQGSSEYKAVEFALLNGILNAGIEVGGGIETLPAELVQKQRQNTLKSVLHDWVESAAEEGIEEIHQGITERLLNNLVTNADREWVSITDKEAVLTLYGALDEFMGGFVVGGILGGVQTLKSLTTTAKCALVTQQLNERAAEIPEEFRPKAKLPAEASAESVEQYYMEMVEAEAAWHGTNLEESEDTTKAEKKADSKELLQKLRDSIPDLDQNEPVAEVKGTEFAKGETNLITQVENFFKQIGNKVSRKGFGEVILNRKSVKDDIAHGIGRAKAATFAAVPDVIAKGQQIDFSPNWKGRGKDSFVFAGKINLAGNPSFVACVVLRGGDDHFYLHEVLDESGNIIYKIEESPELTTDSKYGESERTGFKTSFSSDPGVGVELTRDSDDMISKNASEVKRGSTPNLEEIRGRDVDAMTVDGLEYSVTATVNGYTARIADGDTTLWVQRGIENRTKAVDALENAEFAEDAKTAAETTAENETEDMNDGRGNGFDGDPREADADSGEQSGGSAELSREEWAERRAAEAAGGREIKAGGYTFEHEYVPGDEDTECALAAREIPEAKKVIWYTGEVKRGGRTVRNVNGTVDRDGNVYLRADRPELELRKTAKHERWHLLCAKDPQLATAGAEALKRVYSAEELESLTEVYRDVYRIAYGRFNESGSLINADEIDRRVLQEICADAYARISEHDERVGMASGEISRTQAQEYKDWKQREAEANEAAEKKSRAAQLQKTLADLVRGKTDKTLAKDLNAMGGTALEEMKTAIRQVLTELGIAAPAGTQTEAGRTQLDLRTDAEREADAKAQRAADRAAAAEERRNSRRQRREEAAAEYAERKSRYEQDQTDLQERIRESMELTGQARRAEMYAINEEYSRLESESAELTRLERKSKGTCSLDIDEESNHIDRRSADAMGSRDIKAFGYDWPELHSFYAEAAGDLQAAAERSVKGERFYSRTDQEGNSSIDGLMVTGQNRQTTDEVAWLLDECGMSYGRIEAACKAIRDGSEAQNNRDAKIVELALDRMLSEGWTDMDGYSIPHNQEYIDAKNAIPGAYKAEENGEYEGEEYELPLSKGKEHTTAPVRDEDEEVLHLKEQIRANKDTLNKMDPVIYAKMSGEIPKTFGERKKSIADGLKAYTVIDRKGFGTINFAERQIGIGLGYARSDAELLGFWAVPAVIKRGIEISSHAKHKGNMIDADTPLKTYTFGAKVNLNGEDGIMGVVVRKTNGLNYKAHKILFPDGTVFDLTETAGQEPAQGAPTMGWLVTLSRPAVGATVSQTETEVKQNMPDDQPLSIGESSTDEELRAAGIDPDQLVQTENGLQRAGDLQLLPKDFPLAKEVQNTPDAEGKPLDLLYADKPITKAEARSIAEGANYPKLHRLDGKTDEQALPWYTWVKCLDRMNYGMVVGFDPNKGVQVQITDKKTGYGTTKWFDEKELRIVDGRYSSDFAGEYSESNVPQERAENYDPRSDAEFSTLMQEREQTGKRAPEQPARYQNPENLTEFDARNGREQDDERNTRAEKRDHFGGTEATTEAGIRISGSLVGNWGQAEGIRAQNEGAAAARKNTKAVERFYHAGAALRNFARGVADGTYRVEQTPQGISRQAVQDLAEAYKLQHDAEQGTLSEQRRRITRNVQRAVSQLFSDSEAYRPEATGILKPFSKVLMNERTPERVLRSIFGAEVGARAYNYLFRPMYENNAEKVRWMNRQKADVETVADSTGEKRALTDIEKAYAQYVLEGRGFEYAMQGLEQYNKNLVQQNVDAFRERLELQRDGNFTICRDWVQEINDGECSLAEARQRAENEGCRELFEKVLRNADTLESLPALSDELQRIADGLNWYAQKQAEMQANRDADTAIVENAAELYGKKYDLYFKVLNEHLVMHGYDEIGYIEGYAPHMQKRETQSKMRQALSLLGIQLDDVSELPASIAGRTAEFKPNMRWNPHFQHRTSTTADYENNIVRGFESYLDYMGDIIYHTDDIMKLREAVNYYRSTYASEEISENLSMANIVREGTKAEKAEFLQGRGLSYTEGMSVSQMNQVIDDYISAQYENAGELSKYSEFATWLENTANIMAGKQSLADRGLEYSGGRKMLGISRTLMKTFSAANVAGSISSVLNQTAQLPLIVTRLGEKYTLNAIRDIASGKVKAEDFMTRSDYLTGKRGVDMIEKGTTAEQFLSGLFKPAGMVDELISTVAVRGEYLRQLDRGMSEETALRRADDFGRRIMGSRVKGEKPQGFESKRFVSQMLHVFQVECMNTWDYVASDMPQEIRDIQERQGKNAAAKAAASAIIGYLLRAFLLNRLAEETYGGTPAAMDLFGMTAGFFASGRGLPTNKYLLWAIDNGMEKMTDERLFGTEREDGNESFDTAAALSGLAYDVSNDLPYVRNAAGIAGIGDQTLPTVGVNEIAKGAKNIWKGALGEDGKLGGGDAYIGQMVKGALDIGAQTLPVGRQIKKTVTGATVMGQGGSYSGYGDKARLQYAVPGSVWNWSRALLFGPNALGEQEEFYAGDGKTLNSAESWVYKALTAGGMDRENAYDVLKKYDRIGRDKGLTSAERSIEKRKLLASLNAEEPAKLEAWLSLEADGDEDNKKYQGMLSLMERGAKFEDLMNIWNRYTELDNNDDLSASDKATEFSAAVDEMAAKQGWSDEMTDTAKSVWQYRVSSVVEASDYERLMDTGRISSAEAVHVHQVWNGLVPASGKKTVSTVQKLYGIDTALNSDEKRWAAAETLMDTETQTNENGELTEYGKLMWCRENGLDFETYCDARRDGLLEGLVKYGEYMPTETALKVSETIKALTPAEGRDAVTTNEKAVAVALLDIDEDYKLAYLENVLDASSFRKLDIATEYGVTAAVWGKYMSIRADFDANRNGSYTQAEVKAAVDSMRGLSTKQRAALWSMATLGKNNPYDRELGTEFKAKAGKKK